MRHYPAKLLLFGEHILLLGARALAIPVPAFSGKWAWGESTLPAKRWVAHLRKFATSDQLSKVDGLNTQAFLEDVERGLYFESTIPSGYGLGSSGALCAAVYDRYAERKTAGLAQLKQDFATIESYFHGQSSGIDPLTSYLGRGLWIEDRTNVQFFEPPVWQGPPPVPFLLDSNIPRKTGQLVSWFLEKSREPAFADALQQQLIPAHESMLRAWETGDPAGFWPALREVSAFQWRQMPPMVPESLRAAWADCLPGTDLFLKVCGAGGGGFVLGFGRTKQQVLEKFSTFVPVFPFE